MKKIIIVLSLLAAANSNAMLTTTTLKQYVPTQTQTHNYMVACALGTGLGIYKTISAYKSYKKANEFYNKVPMSYWENPSIMNHTALVNATNVKIHKAQAAFSAFIALASFGGAIASGLLEYMYSKPN